MNYIPNVSDVFKFIMFANDTDLFSTIEYSIPTHLSNVNEMLNHELAKICDWLTLSKLSLNVKKYEIHGLPPLPIGYFLNGPRINYKRHHVVFDELMSWKPHTSIMSNRLSKYAGILNKLSTAVYNGKSVL